MTTLPTLPFDTRISTWQGRAIRYLVIYLVLACLLVVARYVTQHIRPNLRLAQEQEAALLAQRDDLEIRVQSLTTPQVVQEWALEHGMQRFAEHSKTTLDLGQPLPFPTPLPTASRLEVNTQWK